MNRHIAAALATAALFASVSVSAALAGAQNTQTEQPAPKIVRTGQKQKKVAQNSCPIHPDVKARTPGKCPKCRAEDRKQKEAQQKEKNKQKESGGEADNE